MRFGVRTLLVSVACVLCATFGVEAADTGLDLLQNCEGRHADLDGFNQLSPDFGKTLGLTVCLKYIQGVLDGYAVAAKLFGGENRLFCLPATTSSREERTVVEKYLRANPSNLDQSARVLIIHAMTDAFPCSQPR